eukprot:CAMPEP_0185768100 /NCGR_PEP_ID=MMETSP1174-20130828/47435_1 /TAXON_ID=35687 /ORGANISM="Dictyocha speculum, Strain CCMP1381" /LENGTH=248 /DNA_ID=CAMNT_0028452631 /DNA_START=50 /DNA_END=796 /DNA_ORIENTATION=+
MTAAWEKLFLGDVEEPTMLTNVSYKSDQQVVKDQFVLSIPIMAKGSLLKYTFGTDGFDIGFSVTLVNNSTGKKLNIVEFARVQSHLDPECVEKGPFEDIESGMLLLRWDNSFSYFRSKKLSYTVSLEYPDEDPEIKIKRDRANIDECMKQIRAAEGRRAHANLECEGLNNQISQLEDQLLKLKETLAEKKGSIDSATKESELISERLQSQKIDITELILSLVVRDGWVKQEPPTVSETAAPPTPEIAA